MAKPAMKRTKSLVIAVIAVAAVATLLVVLSPYLFTFHDPGAVNINASFNATTVAQNQTIRVSVTDRNSLHFTNELPLSGDWRVQNLSMGPCASFPFGIALYQGRYTIDNISSAKTVEMYAPGPYFCKGIEAFVNSFKFMPLQSVSGYVDLKGYWTAGETAHPNGGVSEGVLHPFVPGVYTLVAGDEWGHITILYFQVSGISLEGFSLCPSNCGYPSPYLSGLIYFGGSSPPKSLQLFVNGTDEDVRPYSNGNITNFVMLYKGGFQRALLI
ncbi:MAG: hypothetical protein LYZ70_00060 [Nitrososphaerales archaeon]|nr:hypothetical protein [Nitrososphaerales archaeon]